MVLRRYRYEATLTSLPAPGPFRGEVVLSGAGPGEVRFPVHGLVRPPVAAVPAALSARVGPGEAVDLPIAFAAADPSFALHVEAAEGNDPRLELSRNQSGPGGSAFRVSVRGPLDGPIRSPLAFRTNHPGAREVHVPIEVRPLAALAGVAPDPAD